MADGDGNTAHFVQVNVKVDLEVTESINGRSRTDSSTQAQPGKVPIMAARAPGAGRLSILLVPFVPKTPGFLPYLPGY